MEPGIPRAVALVGDVDELTAELHDRGARIKVVEAQLAVGRHAAAEREARGAETPRQIAVDPGVRSRL